MTGDDLHRVVLNRSLTGLKKLLDDELVVLFTAVNQHFCLFCVDFLLFPVININAPVLPGILK